MGSRVRPSDLAAEGLRRWKDFPSDWRDQRPVLGFEASIALQRPAWFMRQSGFNGLGEIRPPRDRARSARQTAQESPMPVDSRTAHKTFSAGADYVVGPPGLEPGTGPL